MSANALGGDVCLVCSRDQGMRGHSPVWLRGLHVMSCLRVVWRGQRLLCLTCFPDLAERLQNGLEGRGVFHGPEVVDKLRDQQVRKTERLDFVKVGTKLDEACTTIKRFVRGCES